MTILLLYILFVTQQKLNITMEPHITDVSFTPVSEVCTSAVLLLLIVKIVKCGVVVSSSSIRFIQISVKV
jgi:hypothetical protein